MAIKSSNVTEANLEKETEFYKTTLDFLRIGNKAVQKAREETNKWASQMFFLEMALFTMNFLMEQLPLKALLKTQRINSSYKK